MSGPKVYTVSDCMLELDNFSSDGGSFEAFAQAIFDANPMPRVGQFSIFNTPIGHDDPLVPAVSRFVAARPGLIGPGALVRRFGIGRRHARQLLEVLNASRVCLGRRPRGLWRIEHWVWPALQGGV